MGQGLTAIGILHRIARAIPGNGKSRPYRHCSRKDQAEKLEGVLATSNSPSASFAVNGLDIMVDDSTWVFGELKLGMRCVVSGPHDESQGAILAKKIVIR